MIGVGVGVGFGGVGLSPAWLAGRVSARFGARVNTLSIGEDLILTGANASSWTPRAGVALAPTNATLFQTTTVNGRRALVSATVQDKGWGFSGATPANTTYIFIVGVPPTVPASAEQYLGFHAGVTSYGVANGGSAFVKTSYAEAVDGTAGLSLGTAGVPHVYSWWGMNALWGSLTFGGAFNAAGAFSWTGPIGSILVLSGTITAPEIAAQIVDFRRYYRTI